ncbi:MAG: radical SAM/SPASM domain-containing protein [Acidobacteria bacterium]|nr:radical SAM/SPASM domain-containing protein [Acidobacteriota bacterium]
MESIYYVMSWACHRTCAHCYEDRFRPYAGDDLERVVDECREAFPEIIANLPERMTYLDPEDMREKRGRIILAGGEILLDAVRETILYPALDLLRAKYGDQVQLIVQTTGDTLRPRMIEELLQRGVWMVSVSGIDSFHQGLETAEAQDALTQKLTKMFDGAGMRLFAPFTAETGQAAGEGAFYQFFGAQPGTWIGRLWPRGRAMANGLSTATIADNFCNQWSGGLNFLQSKWKGSEVSIEPNGNVYPCCAKTKRPVGNLRNETLDAIIARCTGNPVYEAISMGHPERMGIAHGWSVEKFLEASTTASGYRNLCIGCDRFHDEVLGGLVTIG